MLSTVTKAPDCGKQIFQRVRRMGIIYKHRKIGTVSKSDTFQASVNAAYRCNGSRYHRRAHTKLRGAGCRLKRIHDTEPSRYLTLDPHYRPCRTQCVTYPHHAAVINTRRTVIRAAPLGRTTDNTPGARGGNFIIVSRIHVYNRQPARGKQLLLGREICLHASVEIKMLGGQIGENARLKSKRRQLIQRQRV